MVGTRRCSGMSICRDPWRRSTGPRSGRCCTCRPGRSATSSWRGPIPGTSASAPATKPSSLRESTTRSNQSTDATFFLQFYREPTDAPLGQAPPLPAGTHRHGGAWDHRGRDLDSVEEIFELVTRQYADVVQDDLLGPYFSFEPEHLDWQAHIASVADYWNHVVLLAPDYDIDVLEGHRHLHDHRAFTPALFDRWLQIFVDTVDGGWTGPNATHAKKRATGMARAMSLRYLGKGAWKPAGA